MVPVRRRLEAGEDSRTVERAGSWLQDKNNEAVEAFIQKGKRSTRAA